MDQVNVNETMRAKLEKLLKLAGNNNSPEEAAAAVAKAQDLAFKYNIDLEQVRMQMGGKDKTHRAYMKNTVNLGRKGMTTWHGWLLNCIAHNNFCRLVVWDGLGADRCKHGELFGEQHNIEIVLYLYEYLEREIRRLGKEAWKVAQYRTDASERIWFRSYCHGATDTIMGMLNKQRRQSAAAVDATGTGIVLLTEQRMIEAYQEAYPQLHKGRRSKSAEDGGAYWQGREDAKTITINPALKEGK
jgi:hypothetical protein